MIRAKENELKIEQESISNLNDESQEHRLLVQRVTKSKKRQQ